MPERTMRQEKLRRLGDEILKAGCTAYLWCQEKRPPMYGPYLTYAQWNELHKSPQRKKWDAFYYRKMGWMYRQERESLTQYFRRGYPAWLFLGYRSLSQPTPPKRALILPVIGMLFILAFPLFPGSAVPGWEYTSPMVQWFGEESALFIFNLYLFSGMIFGTIAVGLMGMVIVQEWYQGLRAGKTVWEVFGPPPWIQSLMSSPVYLWIGVYRYVRRFFIKPVIQTVGEALQEVQPPQPRFAFLKNVYKFRSKRERS